MTTPTRIYRLVQQLMAAAEQPSAETKIERLVRAPTQARALAHVARDIDVSVATQDDLVRLIGAGVKVESAGEEPEPAPQE